MGTPTVTASKVEFQPQCVRKAPTALWARITSCGAHPLMISPFSAFLSSNPFGSHFVFSSSLSSSFPFFSGTTHTKLCPASSSPHAISKSCLSGNRHMLPKHTYTTDFACFEFSQLTHSSSLTTPFSPLSSPPFATRHAGPRCQALWSLPFS
ncbi:hypothetical protein V8G54_010395 [Vigna mungo]|uniref:Uncharacterized protein n=1 Tax=Vigna mungo TaxID=3915 RepID=A0AAQ3NXG4_VIGMU